jgi:5-methylcytosine-specific restriction enzyme subunit McrC
MKACVLLLTRHAKAGVTQRKLAELRFLMADVWDVSPSALPWKEVQIDRSSQRWRALLELARLLIEASWQKTHTDTAAPQGITLLFPMNDLFERYIAAQLRRALSDTGLTVEAQFGGAYCLGPWVAGKMVIGDSLLTRPDILVKQENRIVAVLDTKWKPVSNGASPSDIYQMMAYARIYDCPRLILLYPALAGADGQISTKGIAPEFDRLDVATVALSHSAVAIRTYLRRLVQQAVASN